ncbi:MAG TPA: hypothetical protein VM910_19745, partial [Bradyrhizobium sp.]|nr:hypothetical protein [Bradyrhizobium sp.]
MQTDKIVMGQMHGSRRLSAFLKSGDRRILIHRKVLTLNEEWSVSMIEVDTGQLKRAVEAQHACTATLIQSVPVKETFEDETVWEGIVHVFKINGHPRAR